MTKSTITREQQRQILIDTAQHIISREMTSPHSENLRELARIALAAMDSEPDYKERKLFCSTDTARMRKVISVSAGTEDTTLYHAQPAPVVLDTIDTNLIEALRLVQCMLDDYRERNYGDAQGWIRHINTHMSDYTEAHGDDAYSVLHNLITAARRRINHETLHHPQAYCCSLHCILDCCCTGRLLYREVNHVVERHSGSMRRG